MPARSRALTENVCAPCATCARTTGDAQDANAAPSKLHSKVAFGSSERKLLVAWLEFVRPVVPWTRIVSGGVRSTVQRIRAGVGSTCEAAGSVACTNTQ